MRDQRQYKIEVCVVSYDQALAAYDRGADRLELCSRLETAGMTPDVSLAQKILNEINIPLRIMVRETEAGFESDNRILEKMKSVIVQFKSLPIDGFVFGLLKDNRLDREALMSLFKTCSPVPVTIHKAIDLSENVDEDIRWLNQFSKVDTILTSGGTTTAVEGMTEIVKMKSIFKGNIMGAGKITSYQLPELHQKLKLNWYHGRNIL